jgi:hypothetical protein
MGRMVGLVMLTVLVAASGLASVALAGRASAASETGPTVTLAQNGQTLDLVVGQRFLLQLGDGYVWTVRMADPAVVGRVVNVAVVRGAQGLYDAKQPGTTTLEASGDLSCRMSRPPCAAPSLLFSIQLRVRAAAPLPGLPDTGGGYRHNQAAIGAK